MRCAPASKKLTDKHPYAGPRASGAPGRAPRASWTARLRLPLKRSSRGVGRLRQAGVVQAQDDPGGRGPGSVAYVAGKHRDCAEIGAESIRVDLPASRDAGAGGGCD